MLNNSELKKKLRSHQWEFYKRLNEQGRDDILDDPLTTIYGVTGTGKTLIELIAAYVLLHKQIINKVVIAVPRLSLIKQVEREFLRIKWKRLFGHDIKLHRYEKNISKSDSYYNKFDPSQGKDGFIVTHQMLASRGKRECPNMRRFFDENRVLLVVDEAHHIAVNPTDPIERATKKEIEKLFNKATYNILMTGSIQRHDGKRIFGLRYDNDTPNLDIIYPLKDALKDKTIIRSEFYCCDSKGKYINSVGKPINFNTLSKPESDGKELWASLSSQYRDDLIKKCFNHWINHRKDNPRAKMLLVARDIEEARNIEESMNNWIHGDAAKHNQRVAISRATSDDPKANEIITRYREEETPDILITVAMAYEGMDVPRISHIACLTYIRSQPWLEQMFGRALRLDYKSGKTWEQQIAFFFVPNDYKMLQIINNFLKQQLAATELLRIVDRLSTNIVKTNNKSGKFRPNITIGEGELTDVSLIDNQCEHLSAYEVEYYTRLKTLLKREDLTLTEIKRIHQYFINPLDSNRINDNSNTHINDNNNHKVEDSYEPSTVDLAIKFRKRIYRKCLAMAKEKRYEYKHYLKIIKEKVNNNIPLGQVPLQQLRKSWEYLLELEKREFSI